MDDHPNQPWGRFSGLLAAAAAMLIGVLRNLNPDVILVRSIIAGIAVGTVVNVLSQVLRRIAEDD